MSEGTLSAAGTSCIVLSTLVVFSPSASFPTGALVVDDEVANAAARARNRSKNPAEAER